MIYKCDECGKVLPAGTVACPVCGATFENAVPADAEVRRGFSAMPDQDRTENTQDRTENTQDRTEHKASEHKARASETAASDSLNSWLDPTPYAARPQVKGAAVRALLVCAIIAVLAFVASREMGGKPSPSPPSSIPWNERGTK
jgi:uncharacterized Zn finger protein (UPF0148 family)